MKNFSQLFLGIALLISIVLLVASKLDNRIESKESAKNITALLDTVEHYKSKNGANVAHIGLLQFANAQQLLRLQTKDSSLQALQNLVKEYKTSLKKRGAVIYGEINTNLSHRDRTIVFPKDTVRIDSFIYVYPTYKDTLNNEWINYSAQMDRDTSSFSLKLKNKFGAIIGEKRGEPFVDILTYNPYSETTRVRAFQVSAPKPKRWGIGVSGGVTFVDWTLRPKPYIGAGLNYNFIRF
jgi:hypothetical protein